MTRIVFIKEGMSLCNLNDLSLVMNAFRVGMTGVTVKLLNKYIGYL